MRKRLLKLQHYINYFVNYVRKSKPFELTVFLTSACNFRCSHCFYWKKANSNNDLSIDEFKKIASKVPSLGRILFTGGEPFLRKDIEKIIDVFYKSVRPSYITIPTNGFLTEIIIEKVRQILDNTPDTFVNISLSLDELWEKRDKIVNRKDSFQSLIKTTSGLKKLQREYLNLGVTTIITQTSQNEDRLKEIFDFAVNNLKIDNIGFSVVRGNPRFKETIAIDPEKYLKASKIVSQYYQNKNSIIPIKSFFLSNRDLVYKYTHQTLKENSYQMKCYAGILRGVILENGDVFPCEILMEQGKKYLIGNLRDFDMNFADLWYSKKRRKIISEIKYRRCFCTHGCDMSVNIFFNPKFIFKIFNKLRTKI